MGKKNKKNKKRFNDDEEEGMTEAELEDAFDGVEKERMPSGGGVYFEDGRYLVEILRCSLSTSQQGAGRFTAVESEVKHVLQQKEDSNEVGDRPSWLCMLDKHKPALSNFKGFIAAACDAKPKEVTKVVCAKACSGDGTLLAGTLLVADACTVLTKKKTEFTKVIWSIPTEEELEEAGLSEEDEAA